MSQPTLVTDRYGVPTFVNAGRDMFHRAAPESRDDAAVDGAMGRVRAWAGAGANRPFASGPVHERPIGRAVEPSPPPVNVWSSQADRRLRA